MVPTSRSGANADPDEVVDPLTGDRCVIVGARQGRPNLPTTDCPFCVGGVEAPEPYDVRWFPNRWPPLDAERAEVLLYHPDHEATLGTLAADQVERVVRLWAERTSALGARPDVAYVLVFENRGPEVGATIAHPHGQVYAFRDVPPAALAELGAPGGPGPADADPTVPGAPGERAPRSGSDPVRDRTRDHGGEHLSAELPGPVPSVPCALCAEEPGDRLVSAHDGWRAWVPAAATWPYGLVIAPEAHLADLPGAEVSWPALASLLVDVFGRLDRLFDAPMPYMWWWHQRPTDGGEWPAAHVHAHVAPLLRGPGTPRFVAAGELGSGVYFNPVEPAVAAAALRHA